MERRRPAGAFIEVPYLINTHWIGVSWDRVVECVGWPSEVERYVNDRSKYRVEGWESVDAYREAKGYDEPKDGRAWLEPGPDGRLRFVTGVWSTPRSGGRGRRWRW